MSIKKYLLLAMIVLCGLSSAMGQVSAGTDLYPDYQRFLSTMKYVPPAQRSLIDIWAGLPDSAALLEDEAAVHVPVIKAKKKTLPDERIFAAGSNSVFIVGQLKKATGGPSTASFDLSGTAFCINEEGICVTNYHVLKNIIENNAEALSRDSAWFIVSRDKNIYIIDKVLAYSKNNDLAVFRVVTNGAHLQPVPVGKPAQVGAAVYTISHPGGYFFNFSKGIVSRNVTIGKEQVVTGHNPQGRPHIRMEISADYGGGSSGGPVLDKCGNVVGTISVTTPVNAVGHVQMVIKSTIPVKALRELLGMEI